MPVLVTGAPGWLGSRLVERLVADGRRVRCLVQPGVDASLLRTLEVETVEGDVRDADAVTAAARGVESVFHCAAALRPRRIREFYDVIVGGTEQMLAASRSADVRRFLYISTKDVAGHNRDPRVPFTEEDRPRPGSAYARSKWLAEQAVNRYHRDCGLPTVILRPATIYGPGHGQRTSSVIQMVANGRVPIFGDGQQYRSLSYIDNLVDGLLLAEAAPQTVVGQTYFLADRHPYTVIEVVQAIAETLGTSLHVRRLPVALGHAGLVAGAFLTRLGFYSEMLYITGELIRHKVCSIAKAERELGYAPTVELREGMQRAVEWCRAQGLLAGGAYGGSDTTRRTSW